MWRNTKQRNMAKKGKAKVFPMRKLKDSKVPVPAGRPQYYRGKLGESLNMESAGFDLSDPNMRVTCGSYNSFHDPHLKRFFYRPEKKKQLVKQGLITEDDQVLCSLKDLIRYIKYIENVQLSWHKLFLHEEKHLLKNFLRLKAKGKVAENISSAHFINWLIHRSKSSFRNINKTYPKTRINPNYAELVWEINQRIWLEKLKKVVLQELCVEHKLQPGQTSSSADNQATVNHLDQDSTPPGSLDPLPGSSLVVLPTGNQNQKSCKSTDGAEFVLVMVDDLQSVINGIRTNTVVEEVQENLVPALVEFLKPTPNTYVDLHASSQDKSLTCTNVESRINSDSPSLPDSSVSVSSSDSVEMSSMYTSAELLVLEVLNCSVTLVKQQQEQSSDKASDVEDSDLDDISEQNIFIENPSPSPNLSLISLLDVTSNEKKTPHCDETELALQFSTFEESQTNQVTSGFPESIHSQTTTTNESAKVDEIEQLSEDIVGHTMDMVISILTSQGLLSSDSDKTSPSKSTTPDLGGCESVESFLSQSDSDSQCEALKGQVEHKKRSSPSTSVHSLDKLSPESKKVLSETLIGIQGKLSTQEFPLPSNEMIPPDNTDAIMDLINGILKEIKELSSSDFILSGSSTSSVRTNVSPSKDVQSGSEDNKIIKNIQSDSSIEDIISSVLHNITELSYCSKSTDTRDLQKCLPKFNDDSKNSPGSADLIKLSDAYNLIPGTVMNKSASEMFMEEFTIPGSVYEEEIPFNQESLRPLTPEIHPVIRRQTLIAWKTMENLSLTPPETINDAENQTIQHVQSIQTRDEPSTAANASDVLGAAGASVSKTPNKKPTGAKMKKKNQVLAFFRRAWQAVKRTFTKPSNKIYPA
ncbi:uncharacterized protein LOC134311951 [Trichomycterus rosablanca]|uniref:uncharacterized protein LOC134311951 n=1 Tax=Trichomycterus rosablanca TaxID=2290929 RepID=UPI002F35AE5B